jgi:formylglycine-generating enzyme required for sulfatase activity
MYSNTLKIAGISIGAVIITTLAIDASDALSGKGGSLLAQLVGIERSVCPVGMIHVPAALTFSCVDEFEAVTGKECRVSVPASQLDSETNLSQNNCIADSRAEVEPWRYVNREEAAILCARAGKRLPSAAEWYQASLGTDSASCNVDGSAVVKGDGYGNCLSATGIKNAVGNVWEWVSDDVIDGVYQGRDLAQTGYIVQVDAGGVATVTNEDQGTEILGGYFWSKNEGSFGMIRGGFYGSRTDASSYTIHAYTLPTFRGAAVGFRCVK